MNINLMPAWWLSGASIDLDFDNQRYYDSSLGSSASLAPLNSYLSISRASTGYAKTAAGALTSFGNDTMRITDLGLLVEDARTNSLTYSQTFNTASWSLANITLGTAITAPDGTTTALKFEETATNAQHRAFNGITTLTRSVPWTMSAYLKAAERRYAMLKLDDTNFGATIGIDLLTGTTWQPGDATTGWASISSSVESLANGWYRLILTGTPSGAGTGGTGQVLVSSVNSGNTFDGYLGTLGSGIYVWGVQVEQGAFPSSYIPTAGASATRAADRVDTAGGLLSIFSGSSTNSVLADVTHVIGDTGFKQIFGFPGSAQLLGIRNDDVTAYADGPDLNATLGSSRTFSGGVKVGFAQSGSARSICGGGGTVATDANAGHTVSPSLGLNSGTFTWLTFRRLTAWNSKLADATLQSLTAP